MIKTYTGPMFSGKSTSLVRNYERIWNKSTVLIFKPKLDSRDGALLKSKHHEGIPAIEIECFEEIKNYLKKETRTIFIDEIQFLSGNPFILQELSIDYGLDLYLAGLSLTAEQQPFGFMKEILCISNSIEVIPAVCYQCNKDAYYTVFKGPKKGDILIGNDGYIPLCSTCFKEKRKNESNSFDKSN